MNWGGLVVDVVYGVVLGWCVAELLHQRRVGREQDEQLRKVRRRLLELELPAPASTTTTFTTANCPTVRLNLDGTSAPSRKPGKGRKKAP